VRLLLPVLLAIELSLRCQMHDLHFKFEEDRTKSAVAIMDDRFLGVTDRQMDRHTLKWFYITFCLVSCTSWCIPTYTRYSP